MRTFFAFIDESGCYQQQRTEGFVERCPYYVKGCVIIPADSWKKLADFRRGLLQKHTGQVLHELKWNHLWKLRRRDVLKKPISYGYKEHYLKSINFKSAYAYVAEMLRVLPELQAKVVCTVTPNCVFKARVADINIERMHLQDIMQRIEMEVEAQDPDTGLGVVFCDQRSGEDNEVDLRERYHELYCTGDLISSYTHIVDSINFVSSHQSCGIQLADFIAGAFNGFLRGYDASEKLFALRIYAHLRRKANGTELGYGIIDVPKRPICRAHLEEKFKTDFSKYNIGAEDDIPF